MYEKLCYVSSACNRTPNICDWGKNGLICYGSCNSIIIYDPQHPGTAENVKILVSHTKRVNYVKWVKDKNNCEEKEIISGSSDNTAIVWSLVDDEYKFFVLKGHEKEVNVVGSIYLDENKNSLLVFTASTDSKVKIWKRETYGGEFNNIQSIDLGYGLCLSLNAAVLPNSQNILLVLGTDDSKIQLYTEIYEDSEKKFDKVETLSGHENWVRGLDFTTDDDGNLFLASCSQDTFIRIWCIAPDKNVKESDSDDSDYESRALAKLASPDFKFMLKQFCVRSKDVEEYFSCHLQSVLSGHEGWVYSVNWVPKIHKDDGSYTQPMKILSSSLDKTMIIWSLEDSTNLWMDQVRVGEVGGNILGFYGSKFGPDGKSILAHGYLGSFHLWRFDSEKKLWEPSVTGGGHFSEVIDLAWEPKGEFLVSISTDQTTRIHAPWIKRNKSVSWHELARPQVHGYDMSCLAMISRYNFVSGAEEKIVRAFIAPINFIKNFLSICNISEDKEAKKIIEDSSGGPRGASVPSLGLSNKAVFESSNENQVNSTKKDVYTEESYFTEIDLKEPPTEENLLQNTLWPEVQKLYGHGYEVFALAASPDSKLIASACKATSTEYAAIIIWDISTWSQKQKLISHTLTVTQLAFSPDNQKLLSVSRDRRWSIFEKNNSTGEFELAGTTDKKTGLHTRIIWCCSWSHDSKYFVTGSRDSKVAVWRKNTKKEDCPPLGSYEIVGDYLELKGMSVTAVTFAPVLFEDDYLIAMGFESGVIFVFKWNESRWEKCIHMDKSSGHHLTVKRLAFRPCLGEAGSSERNKKLLQLASASSDHSVKIHNIYFD